MFNECSVINADVVVSIGGDDADVPGGCGDVVTKSNGVCGVISISCVLGEVVSISVVTGDRVSTSSVV